MNSRFEEHPESHWWSQMSRPHFLNLPEVLQEVAIPGDQETRLEPDQDELPFSMFLPEPFEPRYRYPVVIWLHRDDSNENELQSVMPQISEQNYIGIAFRGTSDDGTSDAGQFHWDASLEKRSELLEEIRETLAEMSRFFRIDRERIYLAGFDTGATVAMELLLEDPELFSGAIALGGAIPSTKGYGSKFRQLSSRHVLIGWGRDDRVLDPKNYRAQARRLEQTGLLVETKLYDTGHELRPEMLRDVNHWLMSGCPSAFA